MEPMSERRVVRRGAAIHYRVWPAPGHRRALILFHGFASNGTRWLPFVEQTALRSRWHIICPDLRGHGRSPFRGRLRAEDWVADCAAIMDREGLREAVVGGHCLGANIALHLAAQHPGRAAGLVLVEPLYPPALGGTLGRVRHLRRLLPVLAWPVRLLNALGVRRRQLPVLDLAQLDRETRERMAQEAGAEALLARYGSVRHDLRYIATAAYLQALAEVVRPLPPLESIGAPALVLLSTGGLFGDTDATERAMRAIARAEIHHLDARHWIPTEQPEAMRARLEAWLDGNGPSAADG